MPLAMFSVAPIPEPTSLYQAPEYLLGLNLDFFQIDISLKCVPELSPLETKIDEVLNIFIKASIGLSDFIILAKLLVGPTIIKSLYIKLNRFTPKPFFTKSSSLSFA